FGISPFGRTPREVFPKPNPYSPRHYVRGRHTLPNKLQVPREGLLPPDRYHRQSTEHESVRRQTGLFGGHYLPMYPVFQVNLHGNQYLPGSEKKKMSPVWRSSLLSCACC